MFKRQSYIPMEEEVPTVHKGVYLWNRNVLFEHNSVVVYNNALYLLVGTPTLLTYVTTPEEEVQECECKPISEEVAVTTSRCGCKKHTTVKPVTYKPVIKTKRRGKEVTSYYLDPEADAAWFKLAFAPKGSNSVLPSQPVPGYIQPGGVMDDGPEKVDIPTAFGDELTVAVEDVDDEQ